LICTDYNFTGEGFDMPIFPYQGASYLDEKDRDIINVMENFYSSFMQQNQYYWGEAYTDTRYEASDSSLWPEIYGTYSPKKNFNVNRIRPVISLIDGQQRRTRKSTICVPVEAGDDITADQFTKIMMWNDQQEGVLETTSSAFRSALITGMSFLHVWVDYRFDPLNGDIRVDALPYNSFIVDPFFRKPDLSDCRGMWRRSYVTRQQAISLLPKYKDDIKMLPAGDTSKDGKFNFMPESFAYNTPDFLSYDEFYYMSTRTQRLLVDVKDGRTVEWLGEKESDLRYLLSSFPNIKLLESEIPSVKLAIVVQGKSFENGPQPTGLDCYPQVPVLAYYTPEATDFNIRVQGVVRAMRDPQFLYSRFLMNIADILESQTQSGLIYKAGALVNPSDAFMTGPGKGIAINKGFEVSDVQKIPPAEAGQSIFQLAEMLSGEMFKVTGVNESNMGSADDAKAGILEQLRQGAGLTTLQILFDNLDRAQKLLGRIRLKIIQNNFTPGKVSRIIGEEPSQQFYDKVFSKYDVSIEDGLNTSTQRQMQTAQLMQLRELGIPIPDEVIINSVTVQNKKDITESMKKTQQMQQQMQQQQAVIEMEELQARTNLANARADADRGSAVERVSRVAENQSLAIERRAAAVNQENQAVLNIIKALKELDTVDLEQIQRLLEMQGMIKEQEVIKDVEAQTGETIKTPMSKTRKRTKKGLV
jgi:hypothetical protein